MADKARKQAELEIETEMLVRDTEVDRLGKEMERAILPERVRESERE